MQFSEKTRIFVIQKDNEYHENIIESYLKDNKFRIFDVEYKTKLLKKYTTNSLNMGKEFIRIEVPMEISGEEICKLITKLKLKKTYVQLTIGNNKQVKEIREQELDKYEIEVLPSINTWNEKFDYNYELIDSLNLDKLFEDLSLKDTLTRLLIRSPKMWLEVSTVLGIAKEKHIKITQEYLQTYFPEIDFHNFHEFVIRALKGHHKKDAILKANYFIDIKQYSVSWIFNKMKEIVVELGYVTLAYRKGITHLTPEKSGTLKARAEKMNFNASDKITGIKYGEMKNYLNFIKDIEYKHFTEIQMVIFNKDQKNSMKEKYELYGLLEELKVIAEKYEDKEKKKFVRKG